MQDGSCNEPLPHSLLLKDSAALEADGGMYSNAYLFPDSLAELDGGDFDFPELSAFLSEDEMSLSLDLAREAMSDTDEPSDPDPPAPRPIDPVLHSPPSGVPPPPPAQATPHPETKGPVLREAPISHTLQTPDLLTSPSRSPGGGGHGTPLLVRPSQMAPGPLPSNTVGASPASTEKFVCHKAITPVYKQERPRLIHGGLELNERDASATEFCSRAATFIEELSSIFKGANRPERRGAGVTGNAGGGGGGGGGGEEDSSSPDSGYLSPRSLRQSAPPSSTSSTTSSASSSSLAQQAVHHRSQVSLAPEALVAGGGVPEAQRGEGVATSDGLLVAPPHFTQKLKSQEVAEGSPMRLECRVTGNPQPLVRWFCEGRELHHCPDIQIWRDGDLHTLVIAEAFEDDTGRYTCVASNALGADNTSAEVYIEDSEGEGSVSKSKQGAMPQVQKKTTSVSLTIRSPSPKSPEAVPLRSTLVQPLSIAPQRVQSPVTSLFGADGLLVAPPVFTKVLQDAQASEGQVVVLECRVRGSPPLRVQWYRQGEELQDSPDFRILQKKPRSAAEPEEICTLVIAEAFPEDGGLFCCTASNQYGSVNSTAHLTITPVVESPSNGVGANDRPTAFEDNQPFPPPPPPTEISLLEVPPKTPPSAEGFHVNELEIWPSVSALPPVQISPEADHRGRANGTIQNGQSSTLSAPSPAKEAPPPHIKPKPKLNAEQLKQLREQILLEQQEAAIWQQHLEQEVPPPLWSHSCHSSRRKDRPRLLLSLLLPPSRSWRSTPCRPARSTTPGPSSSSPPRALGAAAVAAAAVGGVPWGATPRSPPTPRAPACPLRSRRPAPTSPSAAWRCPRSSRRAWPKQGAWSLPPRRPSPRRPRPS
ncbi:palladin isoform X2 [Clupea harengus]|uniref:Palladin isoform X2 n=1 Tax=Clupea harengus TaxID=7950 RepID=A0A8M1KLB4_CLUHA|nr:palladin isoform X2 [Clupea harengus]